MIRTASSESIPSWLETHPSGAVPPPLPRVRGKLPLGELEWDDMERLCLRLARKCGDVVECRLYGVPGDRQHGIDLYSRKTAAAKLTVYQCKRVRFISATSLMKAARLFLAGEFADNTEKFVFCTNQSLRSAKLDDAWRKIAEFLARRGIRAIRWDAEELTELLRDHREIVFDFFGVHWFTAFFGEAPEAFARRLSPEEVRMFRTRCREFYTARSERLDSGAILARRTEWVRSSILDRFVAPDVVLFSPAGERYQPAHFEIAEVPSALTPRGPLPTVRSYRTPQSTTRIAAERWIGMHDRQLILGPPGIGKSTLLRVVAMDLLADVPRLAEVVRRWGLLLPVWVPFPYWTAQVVAHHGAARTLPEMLREWFEREHQRELWPLVERALEDDRLLLLVDGLDEYADERAAGLVLQQLLSFLDARRVPALLTSRPQGFSTLQGAVKTWPTATLASLSPDQQDRFARTLFQADAAAQNLATAEASRYTEQRTNEFCREIADASGLLDLAEVPLLLGLLVRLALEGKRLPEDRFDACARLVDLLLDEHPQRRREAAYRVQTASGATLQASHIGRREARLAFAALAFAMQEHAPGGSAEYSCVIRWLVDFLRDARWSVCLESGEAHKVARALLDEAQSELGLLIEPAQGQHSFLHRSCQEWLAAEWLRELSPEEQRAVVQKRAGDPQWREVLLGAFRIFAGETLQAISGDLEGALRSAPLTKLQELQTLLAALAYQANKLPGPRRCELIEKSFEWIERGDFALTRERLLINALSTLRGGVTQARNLVRARLQRWFPSRVLWRAGTLEEMAAWPRSPELLETLVSNLHDPDHHNARSAAVALAKIGSGDPALAEELLAVARHTAKPATCAAALEALRQGWQTDERVFDLARLLRGSGSPEVGLVAARCLTAHGEQNAEDRDRLLRAGLWATGIGIERAWHPDLVAALIDGWPGDDKVLRVMRRSVKDPLGERGEFQSSKAFAILFGGFAGDDRAVEAILTYLGHEHFYFNRDSDYPSREALAQAARAWQSHPRLSAALEQWVETKGQTRGYAILEFYHATKTLRMKARLLEKVRSGKTFFGLELYALLRVWGLEDPEIALAARRYVQEAPFGYAEAQDFLTRVVEDHALVRRRLLEQIVPDTGIRLEQVLDSIRQIDGHLAADDVVQACLRLRAVSVEFWDDCVEPRLISHGSAHPDVRAMAFAVLDRPNGPLNAVAVAASREPSLARALLPIMAPLPGELREAVANTLGNFPSEEAWVDQILAEYDRERACAPKVAAAIACARRCRRIGRLSDEIIADFRAALTATGPQREYRRLAGLAGLVATHRAEWQPIAGLPNPDINAIMDSGFPLGDTPSFVQLLEEEWTPFLSKLDDENATALAEFLERGNAFHFVPQQVPPGSNLAKWLLSEPRRRRVDQPSIVDLPLLACAYPRSEALKEAALEQMKRISERESRHQWNQRAEAARLLGVHFAGDDTVLHTLIAEEIESWNEATPIALAHGWPESDQLRNWFERARETKLKVQWEGFWPVVFAMGNPAGLADQWKNLDKRTEYEFAEAFRDAIDVLVQRTGRDGAIASWLLDEITKPVSTTRSITALSILLRSGALPAGFQHWADERETILGAKGGAPLFGYDFSTGDITSDARLLVMRRKPN